MDEDFAGALRRGVDDVYANSGMQPQVMIVSPRTYAIYKWTKERDEAIAFLLERATGLSRYFLRRMRGERRLRILAPRLDWRVQRARFRYVDWKHRNDPEWQ